MEDSGLLVKFVRQKTTIDSAEVYYRNIKNITRALRKRKPPSRQP